MAEHTFTDFVRLALKDFPELREDFEDSEGFPYLQVGALARLMQRAKNAADWDVYGRASKIVDRLITTSDKELWNALHVSLLEHIDFEGPRGARAWSLLSPNVQAGWRDITAYNKWIAAGAKGDPPDRELVV